MLVIQILCVVFLWALVIGLFWYIFFLREDESGKYRGIIKVMTLLYGLLALGILGKAFEKPTRDLWFWLQIEFGLLLFLIALAHFLAVRDYERTIDSLRYYAGIVNALRDKEKQKNDEDES